MQISNRSPLLFRGTAIDGQEPQSVKEKLIDSHTFKHQGKTYRVWDEELKTLENANRQYTRDTLTRQYTGKVPEGYGSVLEPTRDKKVLAAAEEQLKAVYKFLIDQIPKNKQSPKEDAQ